MSNYRRIFWFLLSIGWLNLGLLSGSARTLAEDRLPGTAAWEHGPISQSELAEKMVAGIDRFLLRETENSMEKRPQFWQQDWTSPEAREKSVASNRERLQWIFGLRDPRVPFSAPELSGTLTKPAQVGVVVFRSAGNTGSENGGQQEQRTHTVYQIRWPVLENLHWEGLLIEPTVPSTNTVILIPDAGQSPEEFLQEEQRKARLQPFLTPGMRLIIPAVISREVHSRGRVELTDREFLYRTSFEMGRHPLGYEIQAVLALVDWLTNDSTETAATPSQNSTTPTETEPGKIGFYGIGEGGLIALVSTAVDPRIDAVAVSGYFGSRQNLWQEPLDRNLFGYLEQFGDAELATLVAPRPLIIEAAELPSQVIASRGGGPGRVQSPAVSEATQELKRAYSLLPAAVSWHAVLIEPQSEKTKFLSSNAVYALKDAIHTLQSELVTHASRGKPLLLINLLDDQQQARQARLVAQISAYNEQLLLDSPRVRKEFFSRLETSSLESFSQTAEFYRDYFRQQVIGKFDQPLLEPRPRTRKILEENSWTAYEVVLDVFPDVFASGVLLLPKNIPAGEKRPVVVCQHGLEGLPEHTYAENHRAYKNFAARLAEQGFVVFAPQNPYRGQDQFRTLQRKANPLGKTLFSMIVPQHEQITRWLGTLPEVDASRIAFYGLSYGGKTAMRVPPLVKNYALSICSGDFNDWIPKNVSLRVPYSYVWTGEYEIYEFDLGNTFNYAEMATLIAPRPFMVERGHFDGVATDDWVASEFAKVQWVYKVQLKLNEATELEWFAGPHTINGEGTFRFLHKHLQFPEQVRQ